MTKPRAALAAALLAALPALAACGASASAASSPADALKVATQGYSAALLAGQPTAAAAYALPACGDVGRSSIASSALAAAAMAEGATLTVDSVVVDGDRGRIGDWHMSPGAPDGLRRALLDGMADGRLAWELVGGEWFYRANACA